MSRWNREERGRGGSRDTISPFLAACLTHLNTSFFCGLCNEQFDQNSVCQLASQVGECILGTEANYFDAGGDSWCVNETNGSPYNFRKVR